MQRRRRDPKFKARLRRIIEEDRELLERNRGYLVFATDASKGVDSAEYQQLYATEATNRSLASNSTSPRTYSKGGGSERLRRRSG